MDNPNDLPVIANCVTVLRYNDRKHLFTLKSPQGTITTFSIDEVWKILVTQTMMASNPGQWQNPTQDAALPARWLEFVSGINNDPVCPAKMCFRDSNGRFVVPRIAIDYHYINLAPLHNGTGRRRPEGTTPMVPTGSDISLTASNTQMGQRQHPRSDEARIMSIFLHERELEVDQLEMKVKHEHQRDWHLERRMRHRPSPYSHHGSPPSFGAPNSPMRGGWRKNGRSGRGSKHFSTSSAASSNAFSRNASPSVTISTSTISGNSTPIAQPILLEPLASSSPASSTTDPMNVTTPTSLVSPTLRNTAPSIRNAATLVPTDPFAEMINGTGPNSEAITVTTNNGELLEVNLGGLGSGIDEFFANIVEATAVAAAQPPRSTSLPTTHEVLQSLSFTKNTSTSPTAAPSAPPMNEPPLSDEDPDLIPEDFDMDADGEPDIEITV
ncbi:hypothetical protein FA13DRAFT_1711655 [Coprinellus micaceus]|uniref:Uncharacterized protein n=1 Tax=Coprinellus micaceus TaxID=71717 RepID=A0A4Y7T500_COPMI|nr:hypothetical protein FA13DRAFT_1711655 [Coprinellus micaceus]